MTPRITTKRAMGIASFCYFHKKIHRWGYWTPRQACHIAICPSYQNITIKDPHKREYFITFSLISFVRRNLSLSLCIFFMNFFLLQCFQTIPFRLYSHNFHRCRLVEKCLFEEQTLIQILHRIILNCVLKLRI